MNKPTKIDCHVFACTHLSELAIEIIEWHDTAVLPNGKLRELSKMVYDQIEVTDSLAVAENIVKTMALMQVANKEKR